MHDDDDKIMTLDTSDTQLLHYITAYTLLSQSRTELIRLCK